MGPIIRVPDDVAQRLAQDTDLVEVDPLLPDAAEADELDVELGPMPGVILVLTETPREGFERLVSVIAASDYAAHAPNPFELVVRDKDGNPHAFPDTTVSAKSIRDHLKLAFFGERGGRRPLIPA